MSSMFLLSSFNSAFIESYIIFVGFQSTSPVLGLDLKGADNL